jgi:hypothetical protein
VTADQDHLDKSRFPHYGRDFYWTLGSSAHVRAADKPMLVVADFNPVGRRNHD